VFDESNMTLAEMMMLADTVSYLSDDILTKVDRASMAVSLETRAPFLSPALYSFVWGLPADQRIGRVGKPVLRGVLDKHIPKHLWDRPKAGFGIPVHQWLRGPLREWAESLLSVDSLNQAQVFEPSIVRKSWEIHLSGRQNLHAPLWNVLMLQDWLEK
jgi:asparagine synthase (glutamine-hydrolysing)